MAKDKDSFAAEILERSASGLAGFATSSLFEQDPSFEGRYGSDGFASWKKHLTQKLQELAVALAAGSPQMFLARVHWTTRAFVAREQPKDDLIASLAVLSEVLAESLPAAGSDRAREWIGLAIESLRGEDFDSDETGLDSSDPNGRVALQFLEMILRGDPGEAVGLVEALVRSGTSLTDLYAEILLPAQREVGRLWHLGRLSIVEEHIITGVTRRAMALASHLAPRSAPNGKTVVVATVAGNAHDLGLQAVADLFESAGWSSIFVGADVPALEIPTAVAVYSADLLVLSAVLSVQVAQVREAIVAVREQSGEVKIILGGPAFDEFDSVVKVFGADGFADRIDRVVDVGTALVE